MTAGGMMQAGRSMMGAAATGLAVATLGENAGFWDKVNKAAEYRYMGNQANKKGNQNLVSKNQDTDQYIKLQEIKEKVYASSNSGGIPDSN